jgi:hypothetical protein
MRKIHFVLAGKASPDIHLAGISRLGADEVVLFSRTKGVLQGKLESTLEAMGVEYRVRPTKGGYFDAFLGASEEAIASMTNDSAVAVNMSTGQYVELSAIEDAVRIQLSFFHRRNERGVCSAYRYYLSEDRPIHLEVAPFWNYYSQTHNDILELLSTEVEPLGVTQLWDAISTAKEIPEGFEAFRKSFRTFRRWMKNTPCFHEEMEKVPRYKIDLK